MSIYDFKLTDIDENPRDMEEFKGKVLLIVNTASKCGFTSQYKGLESLYQDYKEQGLEILGFPCDQFGNQEPGSADEIKGFCELNFGVTFPLFEKTNVNGDQAHPLFKYLTNEKPGIVGKGIKWNFTKFLVDREGNVIDRFAPVVEPEKIKSKIEELLSKSFD